MQTGRAIRFLEALGGADYDHDGLIGVSDLARYLDARVPKLTDGGQRPEVELRGANIRILAVGGVTLARG